MKTASLTLLLCAPLMASDPLAASPAGWSEQPGFFEAETPFQMFGMAATGAAGGLVTALVLGGILSNREKNACQDELHQEDGDSWGCGLAGIGGLIQGALIGFPIGHGLGAGLAGYLQGKHGAALTMVTAVAGDFALGLLAFHIHDRYDGKWLDNGELDQWLIYGTLAGGMLIPIATQTVYDYHVRFPLRPRIAFDPGGDTRMRMEVVQVGF